jgi:nitroreductase
VAPPTARPPLASLTGLAAEAVLQPPALSPLLRRIDTMHRRSLSPPPAQLSLDWLTADRPAELLALLESRRSAVAFAPGQLGAGDWKALCDRCQRSLQALHAEGGPRLRAYALSSRVEGLPSQLLALNGQGPRAPSSFASPEVAAAALREACQAQPIAAQAAATIVLGLPLADLPRDGQPAFRVAALSAGAVCADLYLEAGRRGVGTTSIGGFDAAVLQDLLGDAEICPLVAQAFGAELEDGAKLDAVPVADHRPQATG